MKYSIQMTDQCTDKDVGDVYQIAQRKSCLIVQNMLFFHLPRVGYSGQTLPLCRGVWSGSYRISQ